MIELKGLDLVLRTKINYEDKRPKFRPKMLAFETDLSIES